MGYGTAEMRLSGTLSEHGSEQECEQVAVWDQLVRAVHHTVTTVLAGMPKGARGIPQVTVHGEAENVWSVEDWRAGRPCLYDSHRHFPDYAPPDVVIGWGRDHNGAQHTPETARMACTTCGVAHSSTAPHATAAASDVRLPERPPRLCAVCLAAITGGNVRIEYDVAGAPFSRTVDGLDEALEALTQPGRRMRTQGSGSVPIPLVARTRVGGTEACEWHATTVQGDAW